MPRAWSDYTAGEWARLRPLMHAIKTSRYRAVDAAYRRRPAVVGDVASIGARLAGNNALVTIAFADANAARWQIALVRHYVPNAVHVIADNSPTEEAAARLRHVCEAERALYVRLPKNPWTGKAPSRSHGIALNWVWHNLIRPHAPHAFGFIDDDLFPTAPDDPFAPLAAQDIFGQVRRIGERWFLWAGFCMYRFDRVAELPLDFGQDWFIGLDTGGGNWDPLYSRLDIATLREAETSFVPFKEGLPVADGPLQWCGSWLHEVGLMGRPELAEEKRATVERIITPHLAAALRPYVATEHAALG